MFNNSASQSAVKTTGGSSLKIVNEALLFFSRLEYFLEAVLVKK